MMINWLADYLFSFVEIFMSFIFCEAFFEKRPRADKLSYVIISFALAAVVIALNSVRLFSLLNTAIFFIILCFINIFLFNAHPLKIIVIELTYFIIVFLSETVICTTAAQIAGLSAFDVSNNFSGARIAGGVGTKILLATICIGVNKLLGKNRDIGKMAFALGFVGTVILIVLSAVIYYKLAENEEENGMIALLFFLMLALLFSTFIAFVFFMDFQRKNRENELILQQNQYLERSLKEQADTLFLWRQSIHDYKNTILTLDSYIEQNRSDELNKYIHGEKAKLEQCSSFFRTGNPTVDTIINTKYSIARKNKIPFAVNAKMSEKCVIPDIQLASVIGNLLDNAIEAQENENDPFIAVQILTAGELLIIKIVNRCSCPPESLDTAKEGKKFHGIGLKSVERTVRQYSGDFSIKFENETAIAMVIFPNKL